MKRKFIIICGSLLLLAHAGLRAQMKRVIRNHNGSPVMNIAPPASFTNSVSCSPDTVFLTTQAQIDNLPATYPSCVVFKYIIIDGKNATPAITNLSGMSAIATINKNLEIRNTRITSLSALSGLITIGDSLILKYDTLITSIGLNNLTQLGGIYFRHLPLLNSLAGLSNNITQTNFIFMDSTGITNFSGLSNIVHITQNIEIDRSAITNTDALAGITTIGGWLWMDGDTLLTRVHFNNLTECHFFVLANSYRLTDIAGLSYHLADQFKDMGTLIIGGIGVTNLSGMDSIRSVPNFYISSNPNLVSLHGLEHLTGNIGSGASIFGNGSLTDISALNHVTAMDNGVLEIAYDYALTDLSGLQNISSLGALWVNSTNLDSLNHLKSNLFIRRDFADTLRIFDNNNLSYCAFPPICTYLANAGRAYLNNNAVGCSDTSEVVAACNIPCILEEKTWNGAINGNWDEPANWTPAGVPGLCTRVTIPSQFDVGNFPNAGSNISIGGLVMLADALLKMQNHSLTVSHTFNLNSCEIDDGTTILATQIFEPTILGSTIHGNFSCTDFGGVSQFGFNNFYGNTILSDSTGRQQNCQVFLNNFYGNLSCTQNTDYGNFYLANASPGNDYIQGNLVLTNNSTGGMSVGLGGGQPIKVDGDITATVNNGTISFSTLTLSGTNSSSKHITYTGIDSMTVHNLYVERYGNTVLDQNIHITNILNFNTPYGTLITTASKILIMDNGTSAASSGGFVNGPMKKIGNQAFNFPIGKIENNTVWYASMSISAPSSPTDEFTAEYFWHNPNSDGYDTSHYTPGFGQIRGREYWNLTRNAGTSNVSVALTYDTTRSGFNPNYQTMQVAGWNGSLWHSWGTSGYNGDFYRGNVTSGGPITQYGPLALSWKPLRKPVITMGPLDTIHCVYQSFYVAFTLDTSAISNNNYHVEVSDTLGHFSTFFNPGIGSKNTFTSDSIYCTTPFFVSFGKPYKLRIVGSSPSDTSINTRTVIFHAVPNGNFTIVTVSDTACLGSGPVKYYASPHETDADGFHWSTAPNATITTDHDTAYVTWAYPAGSYSLAAVPYNRCYSGTGYSLTVTVSAPAPTAAPAINNNGRWLYASAAPAGTGTQWFKNGVLINGATGSSYYASLSGTYTCRFTSPCGPGPVSNAIIFAANSISQTINFPQPPNRNYGDAPFVPVASASSGLPVAFTILSGPATVNTQTNAVTVTGTGIVTIRASQSGDNTYDTAAPVTHTFNVNKAAQTISFATIPDQDIQNNNLLLSATASSGLNVTYSIVSGPATISGNTLVFTGVGTATVKASQAGDNNYLAAPDVSNSFCIYVSALSSISGFTNLCPGTAAYNVNNISGATYHWRIAGGSTLASTTNSTNVTWAAPGDYILIVNATGNCGAASTNDSLHVHVVSGIQPDSVHGMLPVNGAINQQLPLTLSWIPAQPSNFYTFDVYIWKAIDPQPATPTVSGITTVNYTIPVNSGLLNNTAYKWMVVAHNGSCTQINTGPVQQFTLIPLADLVVSNVQAPATAFSGQTIAINWTVTNPGPGKTTTNQSWTDAVFLSFDTIPNFIQGPQTDPASWSPGSYPIRPLLVGTRPNVTALDAGQHYSNSMNFTLPLNYNQTIYAYVITNYPSSGNAPQQVTVSNDTARAPQPTVVTLSPTPDLRVDTVFTPNSSFSGSTVNVTYKVKNYGVVTPSGSIWEDRYFISPSPIFDPQNAVLLKAPKANGTYYANAYDAVLYHYTQLLPDSTYTNSLDLVIPNYIFGTYFIHVFTNSGHNVYEGALANNNINHSQMQIFLTPTPHLTINSLTLPVTTAAVTQPIGVTWNILNTGFNDNIERHKGHYFVRAGSCLIPPPPCGCTTPNCTCPIVLPTPGIFFTDSLGFGSSYWPDHVYLSTDSTLTAATLGTAIDLGIFGHGSLNSGLYVPDYYSNPAANGCKPLGTAGSQFNLNTYNVVAPNGNYPGAINFGMPANLVPGDYYLYVYANSTRAVYEYPGTPEIKRSTLPVTVQRPDVVVSAISAPTTATGAQPISISYTVYNNGPAKVFNYPRNDAFYVSTSSVFDGSAQLVGTQQFTEDLNVGTGVQHSYGYTFPISTSGTRYIFVRTNYDSLFRETNSNNNISTAAAVSVSPGAPADLIVSSILLSDTVYSVYPAYLKYTVPNNGIGTTAGAWTDSIFISCNPLYNNATNIFIAKRNHNGAIAPGGNYSDSFYLNLPMSFTISSCFLTDTVNTAYFFIKTNADNGVYEGNNGNNNVTVTGSRVFINPLIDQIVTTVSGADTGTVGRQYPVGWTVKNIGMNPGYGNYYSGWYDGVYFSPDSTFTSNAVLATYFGENTLLDHNATYPDNRNFTVPNISTGDYYLLMKTNMSNSIVGERNTANNANVYRNGAGAAKKVHIIQPLLPDLTDSILSCSSIVATGQPLTMIHRVTNRGPGVTYPGNWSDDVMLSTDFIANNGNDIILSGKNHVGALQPGQYFDDTVTVTIGLGTPPANYVLISRVNSYSNVFETNSNNNLAFKYVTVYSPAPADLIVESIAKPDTVYLGYELDTAKWVIKNNSPNTASGISSDGIYLSHSAVLDSTATLLGIKNKMINMGPLARDTIALTPVVYNVTEGSYNVLVKTDLLNNIVESDKTNNTTAAAGQLYVNVKELPLNVLTPNTLYTINRFYKLIIPDSLINATIRIRLISNDSLTMNNQLYVGKGYIPSAANFDFAYGTPNYGNQNIIMTSVTAGVYYITVRCVSPNPLTQNITLKAEKLPFLITGVQSSSGGNIGNVTIKISGSLFTNNMTAKLTKAGTTITALSVYYTNSIEVYATFNLQGKPLGIYDVTLTKPDTTAAVLPQSFSIVAANNGGINTGGGVNTGAGDGNAPGCDPGAAAGINSQLVTEMVVPARVFGGWVFVIQINYNNPTNSDIPAQTRTLYSEDGLPVSLIAADLGAAGTSLTMQLTEQNGPPGIIRAGGSGSITVYSRAPVTFPAHKHAKFSLK